MSWALSLNVCVRASALKKLDCAIDRDGGHAGIHMAWPLPVHESIIIRASREHRPYTAYASSDTTSINWWRGYGPSLTLEGPAYTFGNVLMSFETPIPWNCSAAAVPCPEGRIYCYGPGTATRICAKACDGWTECTNGKDEDTNFCTPGPAKTIHTATLCKKVGSGLPTSGVCNVGNWWWKQGFTRPSKDSNSSFDPCLCLRKIQNEIGAMRNIQAEDGTTGPFDCLLFAGPPC